MFVRSRRGLLLRLSGPYTQADGHGFHPAPIARAGDRSSITIIETSCNANIMLVGTNAIGGIDRHPAQPRPMRFGPGVRRLLKPRPVLPQPMARYIARGHSLAACGAHEDMGQLPADT